VNSEELNIRTKKLALEVIRFIESVPKGMTSEIIGKQVVRSATSVAANYRSACRARSRADFVNKLGLVEEEADETLFWLEMLVESGKKKDKRGIDSGVIERGAGNRCHLLRLA
jgi:four helix bundle protein